MVKMKMMQNIITSLIVTSKMVSYPGSDKKCWISFMYAPMRIDKSTNFVLGIWRASAKKNPYRLGADQPGPPVGRGSGCHGQGDRR